MTKQKAKLLSKPVKAPPASAIRPKGKSILPAAVKMMALGRKPPAKKGDKK